MVWRVRRVWSVVSGTSTDPGDRIQAQVGLHARSRAGNTLRTGVSPRFGSALQQGIQIFQWGRELCGKHAPRAPKLTKGMNPSSSSVTNISRSFPQDMVTRQTMRLVATPIACKYQSSTLSLLTFSTSSISLSRQASGCVGFREAERRTRGS